MANYFASRERPQLHVAYADTLSDALFAAAAAVKEIEENCCGFDVTVNPPGSYDGDLSTWTVNVYAIVTEEWG